MAAFAATREMATQTSVAAGVDRLKSGLFPRKALWTALVVAGVAAVFTIGRSIAVNFEAPSPAHAERASVETQVGNVRKSSGSADYFETLAELGIQPITQDPNAARVTAEAAVALDPSRASAWAAIAYLESRSAGEVTLTAQDALKRSMEACPLCDETLIRWRFDFVLAHWASMPETMRRRAFEHAEILHWNGQNAEFLANARAKALDAGIPFDDYRAGVDMSVRSIGVALQMATASPAEPAF